MPVASELDVLGIVSARLTDLRLPFMLTGSFALAYYATPRMTRDLDIVVALGEQDIDRLVAALSSEFYVDGDMAREAVRDERLFNLMHLESGIKVDLIVRKSSEYRQVEFERRRPVVFATLRTWIVSPEDLILSKLVWARDSGSELQMRDVRQLLATPVDIAYIRDWAPRLGVEPLLNEALT
jgi:Nucleotidyl transferase AbiEii toxin, Type IV TA system